MLVRPVIGVHRLSERLRSSLPVAVMVAITMGARLALPGYGPEFLRHLLPFLRLLALLCLLTRALGGKLLLTLRIGGIAPIAIDRAAQGDRKGVVKGTRVSVRVGLGGSSTIKKTKPLY